MKFYSTSGKVKGVGFKQAVLEGFAKDGGLYLPESFPQFSKNELQRLQGLSFLEISIELAKKIFQNELDPKTIVKLCEETFDFPIPFLTLSKGLYFTELFHGPTFSFKDFGARFLAKLIRHWKEETTVLVATSGDTGSAVGNAFLGIPEAKVFILFPKGKTTPTQELQITTIGQNVQAIEIAGTFEDCQTLLKKAVLDADLPHVTTGNSINIGRIFPQALYYFYSFLQLANLDEKVIFSIPSGNFGHLVSGIFANKMGLPVERFLAATNINDEIPLFLKSGVFKPHPAYKTVAVSMDVGNPSNFARLVELFDSSLEKMKEKLLGVSFTDEEIIAGIQEVYAKKGYLLDPHGATGYLALKEYFALEKTHPSGIFFATAHPAKFNEALPFAKVVVPEKLKSVHQKQKNVINLSKDYNSFKEVLQKSMSPTFHLS